MNDKQRDIEITPEMISAGVDAYFKFEENWLPERLVQEHPPPGGLWHRLVR